VHNGGHFIGDLLQGVLQQEREDVFFAREVVVQRRFGDSGGRGDVFDLGVIEAAFGEQFGRDRKAVGDLRGTSRIAFRSASLDFESKRLFCNVAGGPCDKGADPVRPLRRHDPRRSVSDIPAVA
jgi:hypothetical protein